MLPEYAHIITEEQRDFDGYYTIGSSRLYIFPFYVPETNLAIQLQQVGVGNQDLSLRAWFSWEMMGDTIFPQFDSYDFFPLQRHDRIFKLTETKFDDFDWSPPIDQPVYLNIQNLQNRENFFKAYFDVT